MRVSFPHRPFTHVCSFLRNAFSFIFCLCNVMFSFTVLTDMFQVCRIHSDVMHITSSFKEITTDHELQWIFPQDDLGGSQKAYVTACRRLRKTSVKPKRDPWLLKNRCIFKGFKRSACRPSSMPSQLVRALMGGNALTLGLLAIDINLLQLEIWIMMTARFQCCSF